VRNQVVEQPSLAEQRREESAVRLRLVLCGSRQGSGEHGEVRFALAAGRVRAAGLRQRGEQVQAGGGAGGSEAFEARGDVGERAQEHVVQRQL
jgi:hypothetical protein